MTNTKYEFSEKEKELIERLGSKFGGTNEPLADEADRCKLTRIEVSKSQKKLRAVTVDALSVAYRVFLRCEYDTDNQDELMKALGVDVTPQSSFKRLSVIIKSAVTKDRKYASKLTTIVKFAIAETIAPDKLTEFVDKHGGIAKCIKAYMRSDSDDEDEKTSPPLTIKILLTDQHVREGVENFRAKAIRLQKKQILQAKLAFLPNGTVKLRPFVDQSAGWADESFEK